MQIIRLDEWSENLLFRLANVSILDVLCIFALSGKSLNFFLETYENP